MGLKALFKGTSDESPQAHIHVFYSGFSMHFQKLHHDDYFTVHDESYDEAIIR